MKTLRLDVTEAETVRQVVKAVSETEGCIDVLINNAGCGLFGPLLDLTEAEIAHQFQANVFAHLYLVQQAAPVMKAQGSGLIVNIGSVSNIFTTPFAGAYCATKAAVHSLSDALRIELAPFGIRVVTVQPGAIASRFGHSALQTVEQTLKPDSWCLALQDNIRKRAGFSQLEATSAETLAAQLVPILQWPNPPAEIRLGKKSLQLPLMKRFLPTKVLDGILAKTFGLAG